MLRCGIVLLTVIALTLGTPPLNIEKGTQTSDDDQKQGMDFTMPGLCIFGSPTLTCYTRCGQQNMKPFCEEQQGLCVCIPDDNDREGQSEELSTKTPLMISSGGEGNDTDTSDDNKLHMVFYIFDLGSLFGDDNETVGNVTDIVNVTDISATEDVNAKLEVEKMKGLASTHVLAMIIVALLSVLILVELVACLKKQKAKHKEANLFNNSLGIPNKS